MKTKLMSTLIAAILGVAAGSAFATSPLDTSVMRAERPEKAEKAEKKEKIGAVELRCTQQRNPGMKPHRNSPFKKLPR